MNGAESLVRSLITSGVDTCFTNPGTSEMHFVAALDHVPGMRSVLALFEGVATGAADGYFRMSGRPACTLLHLGPGLANGISNLHNAKKAGSGIVNIVGEHAASHQALDAPLMSDIAGLSRPVSHWVHSSAAASDVGKDGAEAVRQARIAPGQISTLILPSDTAWTEGGPVTTADPAPAPDLPTGDAVARAAEALRQPGTLLLLGGRALTSENLDRAGRISGKTGCALLSEWSNARLERGAGRVVINRVPYPIDAALKVLEPYERIVLVGARAPIGFFAYPGKPARLSREGADIIELADAGANLDATLEALEQETGAAATPITGLAERRHTAGPTGKADANTIAAALAATIPDNAIVVDESITTGRAFFPATQGAAPHSWLNNCGGSIGYGMPLAIGCAIAAPDRKVMALIGDGSAMYTLQALWTMARESLDITVLILANRSYQILRGELTNVGVSNPGPRAIDMLSLDRPTLGWVEMASGMGVSGARVDDADDLTKEIQKGLSEEGPYLIEVVV